MMIKKKNIYCRPSFYFDNLKKEKIHYVNVAGVETSKGYCILEYKFDDDENEVIIVILTSILRLDLSKATDYNKGNS